MNYFAFQSVKRNTHKKAIEMNVMTVYCIVLCITVYYILKSKENMLEASKAYILNKLPIFQCPLKHAEARNSAT